MRPTLAFACLAIATLFGLAFFRVLWRAYEDPNASVIMDYGWAPIVAVAVALLAISVVFIGFACALLPQDRDDPPA